LLTRWDARFARVRSRASLEVGPAAPVRIAAPKLRAKNARRNAELEVASHRREAPVPRRAEAERPTPSKARDPGGEPSRFPATRSRAPHRASEASAVLKGNIPVFLRGVLVSLRFQRPERRDQLAARFPRQNHLVDKSARGGHVRIRELLPELSDLLCA
jgi:hypothetical protein